MLRNRGLIKIKFSPGSQVGYEKLIRIRIQDFSLMSHYKYDLCNEMQLTLDEKAKKQCQTPFSNQISANPYTTS
jgi:hypothetical protein